MTKQDIIQKVWAKSKVFQDDVREVLNAFIEVINESLKAWDPIQVAGLWKFDLSHRKAREGYNPSTGENIKIGAMSTVKFKACSQLKRDVKNIQK